MPEKAGSEYIDMETGKTLIACGIFRHELENVLPAENGVAVHWLDTALHADAQRMKAALDHAIEACGSCIPPVKNCIQAIIGPYRTKQLEADRTMVITPVWIST